MSNGNKSSSQLPSFLQGVVDDFKSKFSGDNTGEQLLNMGLGYFMTDAMETTKPKVGYQGKIPELQGVRQQVAAPPRPISIVQPSIRKLLQPAPKLTAMRNSSVPVVSTSNLQS